ncbi:MAG: aspartyl-tRNA amidotransferase [Candidatus Pacebacteria bacterium CG_4_10_14_0_8_um_filter_42_14]|nr:MAG: aspartyl-tRNA amidotransferase [Candidatus Pacebacteria bacterium CG_4_10_14_0_8_um_filter_42_14]
MTIQDKLISDMKQAMKSRDAVTLSVVRYLRSAIKNAEIDAGELSEQAVIAIIKKQIKQADEAITELERAGRSELVAEETAKKAVLEAYVPAQMDEAAVRALILEVKTETGETNPGKLTGLVLQRSGGLVDGGVVSALIRSEFSQ